MILRRFVRERYAAGSTLCQHMLDIAVGSVAFAANLGTASNVYVNWLRL